MSERYKLSSVTGWAITPGTAWHAGTGPPRTIWLVLDRAFCHRTLASSFQRSKMEKLYRQLIKEGPQ
jgi:hypothetical protein